MFEEVEKLISNLNLRLPVALSFHASIMSPDDVLVLNSHSRQIISIRDAIRMKYNIEYISEHDIKTCCSDLYVRREQQTIETPEQVNVLTKDYEKKILLHVLYVFQYKYDDVRKVLEYHSRDNSAELTCFFNKPDLIVNNRAYYKTGNDEYVVLSKNPYDMIFASQGNGFESCCSLTSEHRRVQAYPLLLTKKGCYIAYTSKGTVSKWSMFNGMKVKLPHMTNRCLAWKVGDRIIMGRLFGEGEIKNPIGKTIVDNNINIDMSRGDYDDIVNSGYKTYFDDINKASKSVRFNSMFGGHFVGSYGRFPPYADVLKRLKFNPDIDLWRNVTIIGEMLREDIRTPKLNLRYNSPYAFLEQYVPEHFGRTSLAIMCQEETGLDTFVDSVGEGTGYGMVVVYEGNRVRIKLAENNEVINERIVDIIF